MRVLEGIGRIIVALMLFVVGIAGTASFLYGLFGLISAETSNGKSFSRIDPVLSLGWLQTALLLFLVFSKVIDWVNGK